MSIRYSLLLILLVLVGCGSAASSAPASTLATSSTPAATTASSTIRAVTTMSILADLIKNVGGERVVVQNVIPVGAGAEDYQPTPQDAKTIAQADVLFFNGHGLEEWLDDLFTSAGKPELQRIELSKDLPALEIGSAEFADGNPHFWLNPQYTIRYVEVIRASLSQLDPAGAAIYAANAAAYSAELTRLDQELAAAFGAIPAADRKMVTNHDAFPYFAERYGFRIVGNVLGNPESEPSAGDLARLVQTLKAEQVKAIFAESQYSSKLVDTLAQEAGIAVVAHLYTDSLADGASGNSYVALMRTNATTIINALSGKSVQ